VSPGRPKDELEKKKEECQITNPAWRKKREASLAEPLTEGKFRSGEILKGEGGRKKKGCCIVPDPGTIIAQVEKTAVYSRKPKKKRTRPRGKGP